MAQNLNAQDFKFNSVTLTPSRGKTQDLTFVTSEYEVFEDITKPYCTGTILVQDQNGWVETMTFMGTERLTVTVQVQDGSEIPSGPTFTKNWIVHSIERAIKTGDADAKSEAYVLNLIEEHAFSNRAKKFSKVYQANYKGAIQAICQDEAGVPVDTSRAGDPVQKQWKAIIPYMHPLEAAEWFRSRMSTADGLPFLLYGTLYSDNIRLASLDKLLSKPPFNPSKADAFVYSGANVNFEEYKEAYGARFRQVKAIRAVKMARSFEQLISGTVGSAYAMTELDEARIQGDVPFQYKITEVLGAIPVDGVQHVYDTKFSTPIGPPHLQPNRMNHQAVNKKTFYPSDKFTVHWEPDKAMHKNKLKTDSVYKMMLKNSYEVTVSGRDISGKKIGVGDRINIQIPDNSIEVESGGDKLKSGYFMIINSKNVFKQDGGAGGGAGLHTATLNVTKFNEGPVQL